MLKIGLDVDGVLANFESGYAPLLTAITGIQFPLADPEWPAVWDWDTAAGVTKDQQREAWELIKGSYFFWKGLDSTRETRFLTDFQRPDIDLYFITNRPGVAAKRQTEVWLKCDGVKDPTVLITGSKGLACYVLGLDIYVDDKWENCVSAASDSTAHVYIYDRPYNRIDPQMEAEMGITRIKTLEGLVAAPHRRPTYVGGS